MYKKIMTAVDGSETAMQALAEAENIAKTYDAALCIVHAISLKIGGDLAADKKIGQKILEQAKSSITLTDTETSLLVCQNGFGLAGITEAIATAVADWDADLVVVGTANRRGLKRFFIGSVAEQLIAQVDSSILLVRPPQAK